MDEEQYEEQIGEEGSTLSQSSHRLSAGTRPANTQLAIHVVTNGIATSHALA